MILCAMSQWFRMLMIRISSFASRCDDYSHVGLKCFLRGGGRMAEVLQKLSAYLVSALLGLSIWMWVDPHSFLMQFDAFLWIVEPMS